MTHVPQRTCVGCRSQLERPQLIRFSLDQHGLVRVDGLGTGTGRGAYLCTATVTSCLEMARRRRALARTLRADHGVIDYPGLLADLEARFGPTADAVGRAPDHGASPDLKETPPSPQSTS